jgi:hypothetical protein
MFCIRLLSTAKSNNLAFNQIEQLFLEESKEIFKNSIELQDSKQKSDVDKQGEIVNNPDDMIVFR